MTSKKLVAASLVLIGLALAWLLWIGAKARLQPAGSEKPPTQGARYPNAVEKQVVFKGQSAREIAELLRLDLHAKSEAAYRLHPMNAWALHLLLDPHAAGVPDQEAKARNNIIRYDPLPEPNLRIGDYWLDTTTGSSYPHSPRYVFSSRFIDAQAQGDDSWTALLASPKIKAKTKPLDRKTYGQVLFEQTIRSEDSRTFQLKIFQAQSSSKEGKELWGYEIQVGVDLG
jgi:hypothetical protein